MLIGICGKARSGKDTVTDILTAEYYYNQYFFAKPLKDACKVIFDLTHEQLYGDEKEVVDHRWGISPRQMLQVFGTDIMQYMFGEVLPQFKDKIYRSFWVEKFKHWYQANNHKDIVVSDVRFEHELKAIKEFDGIIFKVDASKRLVSTDEHASENELNDVEWDFCIDNNGTLEELHKQVHSIMREISS